MDINECYRQYMVTKSNKIFEDLYTQCKKIAFDMSWKQGFHHSILTEDDLVYGIDLSLMKAIKHYDPDNEKGVLFSSYFTTAVINNWRLLIRNKSKVELKDSVVVSLNEPLGYDKNGKALEYESVIPTKFEELLDHELLQNTIDDIMGILFKGVKPVCGYQKLRYDRYMLLMKCLYIGINNQNELQAILSDAFKTNYSRSYISRLLKHISLAANKIDGCEDRVNYRISKNKKPGRVSND